jgi:pyrroline-5-carboxylate reductase
MGSAIIRGLLEHEGSRVSVTAWDSRAEALAGLPDSVQRLAPDSWFGSAPPDVVLVAVKPQDLAAALAPVAERARGCDSVLWCSIAAGVTIAAVESVVGAGARICRVMPNTPAVIGEGMSAYALNAACGDSEAAAVETILGACGRFVRVPEKSMNAVTGLSGSGPAYVYLFIEALVEGGVSAGLPHDTALQLACQTVRGAATLVQHTGDEPARLKAAVMSPGGTTARGLMALEQHGLKYAVISAVTDAARRADELGA